MKATTMVLLCALALLVLEASCKDPCSKDWLRYMVVNACGMDKRHLDRKKLAPSILEILNEVDEEFDRWSLGLPFDDVEESVRDKEPVLSDKAVVPARGFFTRLFEHPVQLLTEEWLGLASMEPKKTPQRRAAIHNAITSCCSEDCDPDSFSGVCGK